MQYTIAQIQDVINNMNLEEELGPEGVERFIGELESQTPAHRNIEIIETIAKSLSLFDVEISYDYDLMQWELMQIDTATTDPLLDLQDLMIFNKHGFAYTGHQTNVEYGDFLKTKHMNIYYFTEFQTQN